MTARIRDYDADGDLVRRLYWLTEKRKVLADMREDAKLTAILDSTPNRDWTIAYNADGKPWKERQLNQAIDRHMARLAKQGLVRAAIDEDGTVYCPLDIHGLRHARGVELARSENSDAQIQAQLAQSTPGLSRQVPPAGAKPRAGRFRPGPDRQCAPTACRQVRTRCPERRANRSCKEDCKVAVKGSTGFNRGARGNRATY